MKSLTICTNLSSNPLQEGCSNFQIAAFDSKGVPQAACNPENCSESQQKLYAAFGTIF
jgi:hypothetical protein